MNRAATAGGHLALQLVGPSSPSPAPPTLNYTLVDSFPGTGNDSPQFRVRGPVGRRATEHTIIETFSHDLHWVPRRCDLTTETATSQQRRP